MNQLAANSLAASARAALWSWNETTGVLTIRAELGDEPSKIFARFGLKKPSIDDTLITWPRRAATMLGTK